MLQREKFSLSKHKGCNVSKDDLIDILAVEIDCYNTEPILSLICIGLVATFQLGELFSV